MTGCEATLVNLPCGVPGRLYMGMCVHEHLLDDVPVEVCAAHARDKWVCKPCEAADGHECIFTLMEVLA